MALVAAARRLLASRPLQQGASRSTQRGMADYHIPKPDTSMDHVFSDSSLKLPFNFEPPSAAKTFGMTLVALAIFGGPAWIMVSEDAKMQDFLAKLEAAKAAKA